MHFIHCSIRKQVVCLLGVMLLASAGCSKQDSRYGSGGSGGSNSGAGCTSVQCSATTRAGARCQRTTTSCNGRCWQH